MLAGCGGSQPPLGAPATGLQPWPANGVHRRQGSSSYQVLYRFDQFPNGAYPVAGLINLNGTLYGTTVFGGMECHRGRPFGCGTVFSITTSGVENLVYTFDPWRQGGYPYSGLTDVNGTFYGTTRSGGKTCNGNPHGCGTVYSVTTSGSEKVLHSFQGGSDGANPEAPLLDANGTFYGTTAFGGLKRADGGTVYSISASGAHTVLYRFKGSPNGDGANPGGGLIDVNGTLYGTTVNGGNASACSSGCGTVYSITTSGTEKVLHRFAGGDGAEPTGDLINVNGTLYGTTVGGGRRYGNGTVYSITTSGQEKVLYRFERRGSNAATPEAGLINVKGTLYGTTLEGGGSSACGEYGCGTVYSITLRRVETVLYRFAGGSDGSHPGATLVNVNGTLYGTTALGGGSSSKCSEGCGTVFALTP
jgi:uncharacterized repeat protein (TIGR03803 family)